MSQTSLRLWLGWPFPAVPPLRTLLAARVLMDRCGAAHAPRGHFIPQPGLSIASGKKTAFDVSWGRAGQARQMRPIALLAVLNCAAGGHTSRPNILFLMADQMRFDLMAQNAPAGSPGGGLRHLDRLAAGGVNFAKAYTSTPSCTPARAAILTGMKPWHHGGIGAAPVAHRYPVEMVETLAAAGYSVHAVGKDHFGWVSESGSPVRHAVRHGYETVDLYDGGKSDKSLILVDNYTAWFRGDFGAGAHPSMGWPALDYNAWRGAPYVLHERYHPTVWTRREAVALLKNLTAASTAPWFVKVSWHRPHSPYSPLKRVLDEVRAGDLPPVHTASDGWDARYRNTTQWCGPQLDDAWCGEMPPDDMLLARRCYVAEARLVDEAVGAVLAVVDAASTFILFTADHGDMQGDHYHHRKTFAYEGSTHIPMILHWPEAPASGQRRFELVELRDLAPTFFDVAGVAPVDGVDGTSLLCVLDPSRAACAGAPWRTVLDLEHAASYNVTTNFNALTDGVTKYVWNGYFNTDLLFNLTADPYETRNLAALPEFAAATQQWRGRLAAHFEAEHRGEAWVKNGQLVQRAATSRVKTSPHYPG
eukprot:TRINITY_DN1697_c0_g2_i1.p1 TRINITY_DN1697_c0_g2~~TRINITY_DN1697_c0_g2_i1.p1  ORF type:complete len:589 (+),score=122.97 TRINITY_DN1697_c0_g2_i1:837-2603(+)